MRHFGSAAPKKNPKKTNQQHSVGMTKHRNASTMHHVCHRAEKEKGKRGTVSFITAKGKGKAPSFVRQKVFLGLRVVAPEASQGDLSIANIAAMLTDSHHEGRPATLKKAPFFSFLFSVCVKSHNWKILPGQVSLDLKEASQLVQ